MRHTYTQGDIGFDSKCLRCGVKRYAAMPKGCSGSPVSWPGPAPLMTVRCPVQYCASSIVSANHNTITEWLGLHTCYDTKGDPLPSDPADPLYEPCDFCEVAAGKPCLAWCDCRACKEASGKKGGANGGR